MKGSVAWQDGMALLATSGSGHELLMDSSAEGGGADRGPRPKELTLLSLGGCTGMDVVSIMRKMQVPFASFRIDLEAQSADKHPEVFTEIRLVYRTTGEGVDRAKVDRAVELSRDRYCGVMHMLNKTARIVTVSEVNGESRVLE